MKLTAELIKVSRYCLHQELSFHTQHEYVQNYEFENFNSQQFYLPTADSDPASYSMYKKNYYGLNCEVHPKMAYILPDYIAMIQIIISAYLCLHFTFCCAFVQVHSWQRKFQCYLFFVGFLSSVSTVSDQNWSAEEVDATKIN